MSGWVFLSIKCLFLVPGQPSGTLWPLNVKNLSEFKDPFDKATSKVMDMRRHTLQFFANIMRDLVNIFSLILHNKNL